MLPILVASGLIHFNSHVIDSNMRKKLINGKVLAKSAVSDYQINKIKYQKLDFYITGLHNKSCDFALTKLSQYDRFSEFLDFVTRSDYHQKKGRIDLLLESKILPVRMGLNFKIPKITETGTYKFEFDTGFLKGLKGKIHISDYKKRCHFYTEAKFDGPHTNYPNFVFSFFSKTMSKVAMRSLFRISQTRK